MIFESKCRNCFCLHFYKDDASTEPDHCFCPEMLDIEERCFNYTPTDNLEYLEWKVEQKEKKANG